MSSDYRAGAASRREGEPMRIEQFEDIEAWQLARELTRKVNERKRTLPPAQRAYGPEGTVNPEPVNA